MGSLFQPRPGSPYGAALAPAIPTHSLLAQVLGITALGLGVTALAAWVAQGVATGIGLVAMIVGFILLLTIYKTRANEALSLALFYAFAACEGVGIAPVAAGPIPPKPGPLAVRAHATRAASASPPPSPVRALLECPISPRRRSVPRAGDYTTVGRQPARLAGL